MTYDVHANDGIYWMSRFMYLDKKEVFMEAYEDAREQLRIYFRRRNGVELPKEQRRIIKSTVRLAVPWREERCRPIEGDRLELAGTSGFATPTQPTPSTKTTLHKRKVAEELNKGEPGKKQRLNNINDGLRKLPSQDTSLETPPGKGKGKASSGPSPIQKLLSESAAQPATPHRPTKTTALDERDIIVVSDDD
ncbi:hypothetical protein V5O48_018049 [Marasmius crinis-equi]|uniref:Uncharacterized protein n=1 Tax=Marasmius crinis-equi TaxID=585013 RepID=A0ABR3EM83_9AGAR